MVKIDGFKRIFCDVSKDTSTSSASTRVPKILLGPTFAFRYRHLHLFSMWFWIFFVRLLFCSPMFHQPDVVTSTSWEQPWVDVRVILGPSDILVILGPSVMVIVAYWCVRCRRHLQSSDTITVTPSPAPTPAPTPALSRRQHRRRYDLTTTPTLRRARPPPTPAPDPDPTDASTRP